MSKLKQIDQEETRLGHKQTSLTCTMLCVTVLLFLVISIFLFYMYFQKSSKCVLRLKKNVVYGDAFNIMELYATQYNELLCYHTGDRFI